MSYVVPFDLPIQAYIFFLCYIVFILGAVAVGILYYLSDWYERYRFRRYFRCQNDVDTGKIDGKLETIDNTFDFLANHTNDPYWKARYNSFQRFLAFLRQKPY